MKHMRALALIPVEGGSESPGYSLGASGLVVVARWMALNTSL